MGTFGFAGVFAVYSYIEPMMTHVAGYSSTSVNWLLALFGVGMTVGNLVGGRLADRALMPSLYGTLGALGLLLALFAVTAHNQVVAAVTLFLIGGAGMACVPIIQTRIMDVAHGAPTLAAAANHSAFNLANASGAFLGGVVITAGFGWTAPSWVGAGLAGVGLALAVVSGAFERRRTPSSAAGHERRIGFRLTHRRQATGHAIGRTNQSSTMPVVCELACFYLGLVERMAARAMCKYQQQSARDRQVAHEMNLLTHDLVDGNAPVRMKDERRGNCVYGRHERHPPRLPAENQHRSHNQFEQGRRPDQEIGCG